MKHLVLFFWLFLCFGPACADPLTAGPYEVTLTSTPASPGLGDNRVHVQVAKDGHPIDVTVSIYEDMVGMPMAMPPVALNRTGPGTYEGTLALPMAGQWKLDLDIHGPQGTGRATLTITASNEPVPAAETSTGPYRIQVSVPDAHVGDRLVQVGVTEADGRAVADAHVYIEAAMPGMALHLHPMPAAQNGTGHYDGIVPLSMVGAWKLTVQVEGAAGKSVQTFTQVVEPTPGYAWVPMAGLTVLALAGLGLLVRSRSWGGLALALGLIAVAVGATWWAHRHTPPDKTMGMNMDMVRADMGMAPSDLQAAVPVAVATVQTGSIAQTATYTGSVVPEIEDTVYPRTQGWLADVRVYAGDHVHQGDVLGHLKDPELAARLATQQAGTHTAQARVRLAALQAQQAQAAVAMAQSDVQAARTEVDMARAEIDKRGADAHFQALELDRAEKLKDGGGMPLEAFQQQEAQTKAAQVELHHGHEALHQAQAALHGKEAALRQAELAEEAGQQSVAIQRLEVDQAEASQTVQQTLTDFTTLRARTTGVVTQRLVDPGVLVQPGTALFKIAATDRMRLQASVAESDLYAIHRGTAVHVTAPDLPRPIEARITSVFHSADPKSHTGTVEALVANAGGRLVAGSYIVMRLDLHRANHVLIVPRSAVIRDPGATVWKVVERAGQTVATRVAVEPGLDNGQQVAILRGLSEGDRVIWAGTEGLQEGAAVAPAQWGTGPYRDMLEVQP